MNGLINVESVVICPEFSQTLTIRRTSGEYNAYGEWEDGTVTEFNATGSWQKVSARELAQLNFGEVKGEVRKFLTPSDIRVSENDDKLSDRAIWSKNNGRYKARGLDDNSDYGYNRVYFVWEGTE